MRAAIAFVLIYAAFDRLAIALGSTRGEAGIIVCAAILALTLAAERLLSGASFADCARALGLGPAAPRAMLASAAVSVALLACLPALAALVNAELALRPDAAWLALGMLAQGGVAEEALFRGFMYRHLRRSRTFWRAAALSAVPFAAAHLPLFWSLDFGVAAVALSLAIASSFPLAWLFDRAGDSIWPGALLHAVIQGGIKVIADDSPGFQGLAIAWVAIGMAVPWLVFPLLRHGAARTVSSPHAGR
jgi:membrane protease YdiL (CAAX protease family)